MLLPLPMPRSTCRTSFAAILLQEVKQEYIARFEKAFGPEANPIYKELQTDARATAQMKEELFAHYDQAFKRKRVKA
mgnify:CR=1 FL=1